MRLFSWRNYSWRGRPKTVRGSRYIGPSSAFPALQRGEISGEEYGRIVKRRVARRIRETPVPRRKRWS